MNLKIKLKKLPKMQYKVAKRQKKYDREVKRQGGQRKRSNINLKGAPKELMEGVGKEKH